MQANLDNLASGPVPAGDGDGLEALAFCKDGLISPSLGSHGEFAVRLPLVDSSGSTDAWDSGDYLMFSP